MQIAGSDRYGCHGETQPLEERFSVFRHAPAPLTRCPWAILREPDPWRDRVLELVRDHRAGVLDGRWRERHSAAVVEAIDYVLSEADAAQAAVWARED